VRPETRLYLLYQMGRILDRNVTFSGDPNTIRDVKDDQKEHRQWENILVLQTYLPFVPTLRLHSAGTAAWYYAFRLLQLVVLMRGSEWITQHGDTYAHFPQAVSSLLCAERTRMHSGCGIQSTRSSYPQVGKHSPCFLPQNALKTKTL
jgi:hypothetical protein